MTTEVPGYVSKTDISPRSSRAAHYRRAGAGGAVAPARPGPAVRRQPDPVRQAMRRLESEGLLRCDTHRASRWSRRMWAGSRRTSGSARRWSLGRFAGRAQGGPGRRGPAARAERADARARRRRPALRRAEPRVPLHRYGYAHSPLLLSLMRLLWASLHGGPRVSRTYAESARQHDEILAALAEGDAGAASARTYQHIMGADPVKEVSG